jgi:thymidine kinase
MKGSNGVMVGGDESYVSVCSRCQEEEREVGEEHLKKRRDGVAKSKVFFGI